VGKVTRYQRENRMLKLSLFKTATNENKRRRGGVLDTHEMKESYSLALLD